MKFHPYSTHNSTTRNHLIITMITPLRWKGGITNEKKYFSGKRQENVLMTVKRLHFYGSHLLLGNRKIRLFLVKSVLTRQQNQGTVFQTALFSLVIIPRLRPGLLSLRSVLSSRQVLLLCWFVALLARCLLDVACWISLVGYRLLDVACWMLLFGNIGNQPNNKITKQQDNKKNAYRNLYI